MNKYFDLGNKLRSYRKESNETISQVAQVLEIDRTYLSKLENGHERPSRDVLQSILQYYKIPHEQQLEVWQLAGYSDAKVFIEEKDRREVENMDQKNIQNNVGNDKVREVRINPSNDKPILYCDSVFISSNNFGVVFDFTQSGFGVSQEMHNVVARVGMSKEHAEVLLKALLQNLRDTTKPNKNEG